LIDLQNGLTTETKQQQQELCLRNCRWQCSVNSQRSMLRYPPF